MINEQDILIIRSKMSNYKSLMAQKNPTKNFNKTSKPHNPGSISIENVSNVSNMVSNKNKVFNHCRYCGKTNHPKKSCFKWRHGLVKAKKKSSKEQSMSLCSYYVQPSIYSSNVEWIMDYGTFNDMS